MPGVSKPTHHPALLSALSAVAPAVRATLGDVEGRLRFDRTAEGRTLVRVVLAEGARPVGEWTLRAAVGRVVDAVRAAGFGAEPWGTDGVRVR